MLLLIGLLIPFQFSHFTCGNTYGTLSNMMGMIDINIISSNLFNKYQQSILIPVISEMYEETLTVTRMIVEEKSKYIVFSTHNTLTHYVFKYMYVYMDWRGGLNFLWCKTGPKIPVFSPQIGWNSRPKQLCLQNWYWQCMTCYLGCCCAIHGDLAFDIWWHQEHNNICEAS